MVCLILILKIQTLKVQNNKSFIFIYSLKVEDHQETDESQEDDDDHQNNNAMNIKVDIDQEQEDKRITEIWHGIRDSKKNERQIPIIQSYLKTLNNTKTLNFEFAGQSFRYITLKYDKNLHF